MLKAVVSFFKEEESNWHEDGKAKVCWVNICWAMQWQWNTEWTVISRLCLEFSSTAQRPYSLQISLVIFSEQALCLNSYFLFFGRSGERWKFLAESLGLSLFSAWNNLHVEEILWGGKFCHPTDPTRIIH